MLTGSRDSGRRDRGFGCLVLGLGSKLGMGDIARVWRMWAARIVAKRSQGVRVWALSMV